ncbi:MAG: ABC transporter substrate-binding protein [Verrucomicrobiota bacterium]|nr:ABC transporter substrate-binding protein [Chthoniobacterales bacterium]MBA3761922.1 ABC transporter substrate-binding protein [Chthoniobacterales bacterium]MDQ3313750.1 ABC transporter substrate-binding protein [Verrucomicrobiota bacterium]
MTFRKTLLLAAFVILAGITLLHSALNLHVFDARLKTGAGGRDKFRVGFLPVTCHLTCPVTDFINKQLVGASTFDPIRFQGWPELKEAYLSGYSPATFILAPMAIALREQGVPIKIVYLGHREGGDVMVHKESQIFRTEDLKGKTVAVPGRYANHRLILYRELKKAGMQLSDIKLVEMPPPDMPAALYSRSVDAITSGEPFMGQSELDGYGRALYRVKDVWPGFISCVLAVHEDVIKSRRAEVQGLVDGIAKSGKWLDTKMENRMAAAQFVSTLYYNQNPRLLSYVLSKPPDRVKYSQLKPTRPNFEEIEILAKEAGILKGTAHFEDYIDDTFAPDDNVVVAHAYPAPPRERE